MGVWNLLKNRIWAFFLALILMAGVPTLAQVGTVPKKNHPGFDLINFRPSSFKPKVSGMAWLPDGSMLLSHWGGIHQMVHTRQMNSKVYRVTGTSGPNPDPNQVQVSVFADGLEDLMGLTTVGDRVFVCGGNKIIELIDADKDGVAEKQRVVVELPGDKARHEFLFGLLYRDGFLYAASSSPKMDKVPPDLSPNKNRGALLKVDEKTGNFTLEAMGLRTPNGLGWGPEGGIWVSDVQGNWLPSCKLIHIKKDAFYGFKHTPREPWDEQPETPPAVYTPQTDLANAPGNPLMIRTGPYAGQFLVGDVTHGGIQRYFVEKVNGEYQGVGFHFIGNLESGVKSLEYGPDSMIYVGGIGDIDGNWNWNTKVFGLQKLQPNGKTAFEMLAVRSLGATSMEIEFTEPLAAGMEAVSNFTVREWKYVPTVDYGGPPVDRRNLTVSKVTLSEDRRKARLEITGLLKGYLINFRISQTLKSEAGNTIWSPEAWYSLNDFGPGTQVVPIVQGEDGRERRETAFLQMRSHATFGAIEHAVRIIARNRDALGRHSP